MTSNLSLFSSLNNSVQTNVTLGNNVQVTILGKGIVGILTKEGEQKSMTYVYHVKGLKHIFLSIGKLIHKCYRVYIGDNHFVIKDKGLSNRLIENFPMTNNRLFFLG